MDSSTPTTPNPPRYRWFKRGVVFALIVVVALIPLRLFWGHREQRDLDRVVEEARAKGYPVFFEDLQPASLPASENRASYILQAYGALPVVNAQGQAVVDTDWYNEGGADYFDEHQLPDPVGDNAAYLVQFQPVLDALREARAHPRSDWTFGQPISRPALNMLLPHLGDSRMLARAVEDAIDRAVAEEEYLLAIAMLGDLTTISDALRSDPYSLLDHLVLISIRSLAAEVVQEVLPQLPNDPALSKALESLNATWLDEDWATVGLSQAFQTELWVQYDYVSGVVEGRYSLGTVYGVAPDHLLPLEYSATRRLLRPYYQSDMAFIVQYNMAVIEAAEGCDNLQDYYVRLGEAFYQMDDRLATASRSWPITHPISSESFWAFSSSHRTHFRMLATSRMCATAIALKRYEIDHDSRPETLDALVPDYLAAVPDDPFVLDRYITYIPVGVKPIPVHVGLTPIDPEVVRRAEAVYPLLYCIGEDGIDHGGMFPISFVNGRIDGWINGRSDLTDWCFFLGEIPKPTPDPYATPFHQRQRNRGLEPPPTNPTDLPGDEEQVDEAGDDGEGDEDGEPPPQPEQREE